MNDIPIMKTGGQALVDALLGQKVDTVFCVPGESYLEVLDSLYEHQKEIRLVACRHESGAGFMAEAYGKLTGRPGICMVTRGPGATNASIAVHTAYQDSTPMILFIGQVGRGMCEREAFQEIDYRRMFGEFAKWVTQIDDVSRIGEYLARAFSVALSGRPGPVVIALPEDMLTDSSFSKSVRAVEVPRAYPDPHSMEQLSAQLRVAKRPLMILGGSGWTQAGWRDIATFASRQGLPVACSFRRQDLFDNLHPNYVGDVGIGINPALAETIRNADLVISVGARLGEMATSGYTLFEIPCPRQKLVHVLSSPEELGRVYHPEVSINASLDAFAAAAAQLPAADSSSWKEWLDAARSNYTEYIEPPPRDTRFDPAIAIRSMRDVLSPDAIVTNGAGNYSAWAHRYHQFSRPKTQLAPTSGAMGYGVPAAIAAKICHPSRQVVCLAGDGCFLMTSQELATAVHNRLAIVFVIFNNGMYGTIRMHQEKSYPGRVVATDLSNPDFVVYAKSFGAEAVTVTESSEFAPALARALRISASASNPVLIEVKMDPEILTPRATLSGLRKTALSERAHIEESRA